MKKAELPLPDKYVMDILKALLNPRDNFTLEDDPQIPEARIWIREIDTFYVTFLILSSLFTTIVVLLAIVQLYYVIKYVSNTRIQADLYYLVLMFPITTICNVVGMFIPRAALFLYAVALVYLMFCLFIVVSLLFNIFGSRKDMSEYLLESAEEITGLISMHSTELYEYQYKDKVFETQPRNIRISFRVAPLCCLKMLPEVSSTERNLRRVEWLVFQTPILRITSELTGVVVFMEVGHRHNLWFMFSQLFGLVSMCVAIYGCYVIVPLGKSKIIPYRFPTLFKIIDIAQCLYTVQKFCFDFVAGFEIISPDHLLSASAKAQFWVSFMLTWEMMTLSAITTYTLRPSRSIFFDKFPVVDSVSSNQSNNHMANNFMMPSVRVEPRQQIVFDAIDCDTVRAHSNNNSKIAYAH